MISVNDTTILAMLSRYPDISSEEADRHIARIENDENKAVCHALLGRIQPDELSDDARETLEDVQRWSVSRTERVRNEQIHARRNNNETHMSQRMIELRDRGVISESTLLLYGISGPMPERDQYNRLTRAEKTRMWVERMERRFGQNWRNRFQVQLPDMFRNDRRTQVNWLREGF